MHIATTGVTSVESKSCELLQASTPEEVSGKGYFLSEHRHSGLHSSGPEPAAAAQAWSYTLVDARKLFAGCTALPVPGTGP